MIQHDSSLLTVKKKPKPQSVQETDEEDKLGHANLYLTYIRLPLKRVQHVFFPLCKEMKETPPACT